MARENTRTGGKPATEAIVPGDVCISIGKPPKKAPPGYEWRALTSVARLETGHTPSRKRPEYWGGEVPWIGIRDATGNHGRVIHATNENTNALGISNSSARILPAETVCLSRTASVGYVVVMGRPMATSQDFVNWVCSDELNPHYLKYALLSEQRALRMFAVGSVHSTIYFPEVKAFHLCMPSRKVQDAVAATLGALDDKIELNRRMNATLEAMARALFQSWFVDFDPVRAKLDPDRSGPPLDPATAALFPEHLEDSPLGHIPKGWEVCSLANKIELLSGGTPKTSEPDYWDGDIPWYSVKDAPSETDVWVIQTEKQVTKLGIENSAAQVLPEGTTIISARGTVGKLALVGTPMAMNQSCYGVRGAKGYADYFTYFALRQATADLQQRTHGTVFDTITRQTFETLDCIFPPAPLTQAFDRTVTPLLAQIRANLHQSRTLATLRDTLLPKLLSGELRPSSEAE